MKYRLTLVVIVIGMLGLVSAFTYAQNLPTATGTPAASSVIQQDIFVRGGPGRDYLPVGKLLAGDHVRPLSRNAQGDWVLIVYGKSYGWIRRDLAFWVENIDTLPVIDVANLTPSPVLPTTPTETPLLLPTYTPVGNWVQLDGDAQSGFVRAGPGRTYLRLGQLLTGDSVEPVSQNNDGSWIMIRYGEGFGWVARNLVHWVDNLELLPIVEVTNLTPSATFTVTNTSTPTATSTSSFTPTATPTVTFTLTASFTPTIIRSATATATLEPTLTSTRVPSATASLIPSYTLTSTPSETLTATLLPSVTSTTSATATYTATLVPTFTSTATATLTATTVPSATLTAMPILPTLTASVTSSATSIPPTNTDLPLPTDTPTAVVEALIIPSVTMPILPTLTASVTSSATSIPPTNTDLPSPTYTLTVTASVTPTLTPSLVPPTPTLTPTTTLTATVVIPTALPSTSSPVPVATKAATTIVPTVTQPVKSTATLTPVQTRAAVSSINLLTPTPNLTSNNIVPNNGPAPEVLIAVVVLIGILAYAFLYWRGISGSERYAAGFVIDRCPVCQRGHLIVESRQERLFGIPRARHSVRCTECRSILREVNDGHWRYAVDPIENPDLYQRFNGHIVDDQTLVDLVQNEPLAMSQRNTSTQSRPPDFVDDDP